MPGARRRAGASVHDRPERPARPRPRRSRVASFAERAYAVIRAIPYGRIASYGGIAAILGTPRAARGVGRALAELPEGSDVPWWRVVNRNGEISIKGTMHGAALQRALLRAEGVKSDRRGRIDWKVFGWDGSGVPAGVRGDDTDDAGEPGREVTEWKTERKRAQRAKPARKRPRRKSSTR